MAFGPNVQVLGARRSESVLAILAKLATDTLLGHRTFSIRLSIAIRTRCNTTRFLLRCMELCQKCPRTPEVKISFSRFWQNWLQIRPWVIRTFKFVFECRFERVVARPSSSTLPGLMAQKPVAPVLGPRRSKSVFGDFGKIGYRYELES